MADRTRGSDASMATRGTDPAAGARCLQRGAPAGAARQRDEVLRASVRSGTDDREASAWSGTTAARSD